MSKKVSHAKPAPSAAKPAAPRRTPSAIKAEVQRLDRDLLALLRQRAQAALDLAEALGRQNPAQAYPDDGVFLDPVLKAAGDGHASHAAGDATPLPMESVRAIFQELAAARRAVTKPPRVAFLGPDYSYSHLATLERFGHSVQLAAVASIGAVFEAVNRGDVSYGTVPLENSTDGRIVDTLDMFSRLPVRICGEVHLRIHHCLLAKCPRSEINQVYSRPQALSQCRDWLAKHLPNARTISMTSTAAAAELARDKPGAAAIASREASVFYGLDLVAENIEDNPSNVTRFAVIGHDVNAPSGNDKTAILFQIPHAAGALADALGIFKKNNLNLTWIESFPIPGADGYLFFVELEGHESEPAPAAAVEALRKKALRLEVLGSFPAGFLRDVTGA